MTDASSNQALPYFPLLLDALRSSYPHPMRPAEASAWVRSHTNLPADALTRFVPDGRTLLEYGLSRARGYLTWARLVESPRRGLWRLTADGLATTLDEEKSREILARFRASDRMVDDGIATQGEDDGEVAYWFVGAVWNKTQDHVQRFLDEGIWENGSDDEAAIVRRIKVGDRIAVKSAFVQRHGLPFDVGGQPVATMRIKATGIVTEGSQDGRIVQVAWDTPPPPAYDWYFYTFQKTITEADIENERSRRLIEFTFQQVPQDYEWFLKQPYWAEKYKVSGSAPTEAVQAPIEVEDAIAAAQTYTIDDIVGEGCFLAADKLHQILDRWRAKKNLVLQGPPGTGKTWLAKRLGFALVGSKDRETARSRLRVVQFHPSLAYEDFVRGWRPSGHGGLSLVDGIFMQAIEAAASEPDRPFVLVIEEINRGNPAQIFGELLTLLEDTKRHPSEAIELAYRQQPGERIHIPENLHVIGTMNVADRSLAIVDLALRRRFAFVELEPELGAPWREWCGKRGIDDAVLAKIEIRLGELNAEITATSSLGAQFRIGHSFVTPHETIPAQGSRAWFRNRVEGEIGPLLDEYWYDAPDKAKEARLRLLADF